MLKTVLLAGRILRKNPVFTVIAVVTIALGVGASTAIFSVTNAVLLRPLPYKAPGQLVVAGMDLRRRNVHDLPFSNADYIDLKNGTRGQFSDMAGVFSFPILAQRADGTPEQIVLAQVTTNFFQLMGAKLLYGRSGGASSAAADGDPELRVLPAPVRRRSGRDRAHAGKRDRRTTVGGCGDFGSGVPAVFSS
jgi:hypothetical protein